MNEELIAHVDARLKRLFPNMNHHIRRECTSRVINRNSNDPITDPDCEMIVAAWCRHNKTLYDDYLEKGIDRKEARVKINPLVVEWMQFFKRPKAPWLK